MEMVKRLGLNPEEVTIRDVWDTNMEEEVSLMSHFVDDYPIISIDTEFPGVVVKSLRDSGACSLDKNYYTLKTNVDLLKLIQLGLTFCDEKGNLPVCERTGKGIVWQINFREFNPKEDVSASDSIELLRKSGIDFNRLNSDGVDAEPFAELLMSSGVVLNEEVRWIFTEDTDETIPGTYDFGYLLKILTRRSLPESRKSFLQLVRIFFPKVYDIKYFMIFCNGLHGGLNRIAEILNEKRIGASHQAGSDCLLTCRVFLRIREQYFGGDADRHSNVLYCLDDASPSGSTAWK